MDPLFQEALDEVVNDGLRENASEATRGSRPNENVSLKDREAADNAPTYWDMGKAFLEGAASFVDSTNQPTPKQKAADEADKGKSLAQVDPVGTAIVTGAARGAYETADFVQEVAGVDTDKQPQSKIRQAVEEQFQAASAESPVAAVVGPISQFVAGFLGAGKLLAPLKVANMGAKAKGAFVAAESALASGLAFDGHEERLSNLVQEFPSLENPVSAYLAASPDDTEMEGRMKAAMEDLGLGALAGGFLISLRALKLAKAGDTEAASALATQLADDADVAAALQAVDEGVSPATVAEKPRVRVKAQGVQREMAGTEASLGKLADDTAAPQVSTTIEANTEAGLKSDPKRPTVPEVVSEQDAIDIVRGTEFDLLRLEQTYWERTDAMIQSGNALAPRKSIPWQKINSPAEAEVLIARVTAAVNPKLAAMKGGEVLKDSQVRARVRNMARWSNSDPDLVVADITKAGEDAGKLVQRMEAGYTLSVRAFRDSWDMFEDIRLGNYGPYGGTKEAAIAELRRRMNIAASLYGSARSMTANAARAVRYMRYSVDEKTLKQMSSLKDEDFMRLMETTGGDPKKLKEVATPSFMRRFMEQVQFSQRNGLLWFYPTHVVNLTGNLLVQAARPTERVLGSMVQSLWKPSIAKDIRDGAIREMAFTWTSLGDGLKAGLEAGLKGDSKLAPHATDMFGGEGDLFATRHVDLTDVQWAPMDSFTGMAANAHKAYNILFGTPTRMLGAQDEFFKMITYRGSVQSKAWVEGKRAGLRGKDLTDFIEDRLDKAFDAEGRAVDPDALYEAQTRTFNQELLPGTLGFGIRNLRASYPALGFVLPFVKTPVNVLRYAHKYTPMLNLFQKEYRQMISGALGADKQAQAIGQMALGGLTMGTAAYLAASGKITGGGPRDPQLRAQLIQDGWRPYSIPVERDGKTVYIPYGRLDPIGLPLGIAADLWEIYVADPDNEEVQNAATATAIALAKNFSERTFLLNVNMMLDALSDPEANMGKFMGGTLRSMMPAGSAMKGYMNQDPYLRDARTLTDRMMQDVPGYSATMMPKRHAVLGYPLLKNLGLTSQRKHQVVEDELMRLTLNTDNGIYAPQPVRNGVDLRELKLKDGRTAYDILQEYAGGPKDGPDLREALEGLMKSKEYAAMEDGGPGIAATKLNAISGIVQNYRESAFKRLMFEYPEVRNAVLTRDVSARAQFLENTGNPGLATRLLNAIGAPTK